MDWLWKVPGYVYNITISQFCNGNSIIPKKIIEPFKFEQFVESYQSSPWVRIAALSGCTAVGLSACFSHKMSHSPESKRIVFSKALEQHFYHTLAMLFVPMIRHDHLAGTLFLTGIFLFCGSCYLTSGYGVENLQFVAPFGGFAFILGWLSMMI